MVRLRTGKHPTDTRFRLWDREPWLDPVTGEEVEWSLYYLFYPGTTALRRWYRYKLVADEPAEHKANYMLAHNPHEYRFSMHSDSLMLEEHRSGLYRKVLQEIQNRGLHLLTEDELKEIF